MIFFKRKRILKDKSMAIKYEYMLKNIELLYDTQLTSDQIYDLNFIKSLTKETYGLYSSVVEDYKNYIFDTKFAENHVNSLTKMMDKLETELYKRFDNYKKINNK